jgi:hypothetical protein
VSVAVVPPLCRAALFIVVVHYHLFVSTRAVRVSSPEIHRIACSSICGRRFPAREALWRLLAWRALQGGHCVRVKTMA